MLPYIHTTAPVNINSEDKNHEINMDIWRANKRLQEENPNSIILISQPKDWRVHITGSVMMVTVTFTIVKKT